MFLCKWMETAFSRWIKYLQGLRNHGHRILCSKGQGLQNTYVFNPNADLWFEMFSSHSSLLFSSSSFSGFPLSCSQFFSGAPLHLAAPYTSPQSSLTHGYYTWIWHLNRNSAVHFWFLIFLKISFPSVPWKDHFSAEILSVTFHFFPHHYLAGFLHCPVHNGRAPSLFPL